jgi:drug/metabolite transporter (DMT)-like permease
MNQVFPLLAVLIWAANTVVSKAAASVIDPAAIAFYRWLIAAAMMTPFLLRPLWRQRHVLPPHLPRVAVLSLLGMVAYQSIAYYAAHLTSATNMGVICALIPLLGVLIDRLAFGARPGRLAMLGVALSLAGVLWLLGRGRPGTLLATGLNAGDGMMLLAATAYALYGLLLKRWPLPFSPWQNLYLQVLLCLLLQLPLVFAAHSMSVSAAAAGLVLFAGLGASLVATYCGMEGIARMGSDKATIYMNVMPVFTALLAAASLGENLHVYHLAGGIMILAGVALVQARRPQAQTV